MIINYKGKDYDSIKRRYWTIVIYKDSVVKDFINILKSKYLKMVLSPLHDKDLLEDGTSKKPHYHLIIDFGGGAKINQVEEIIELINAYLHCEIVGNKVAMYKYLTHENESEKYHYNPDEIVYINSTMYDWVENGFKDILNYIDDYQCYNLLKLTKQLRKDNQDDLLQYVSKNTYYVCQYMKDFKDDYEDKLKDLYNSIMKLLINYDLNNVIASSEIKSIDEKLSNLGIENFEIIEE